MEKCDVLVNFIFKLCSNGLVFLIVVRMGCSMTVPTLENAFETINDTIEFLKSAKFVQKLGRVSPTLSPQPAI